MFGLYWIILIVVIAGLIQLFSVMSFEMIVILFSINFIVLGIQLGSKRGKKNILLRLDKIEMILNDAVSNLISSPVKKGKREIIEWLNQF